MASADAISTSSSSSAEESSSSSGFWKKPRPCWIVWLRSPVASTCGASPRSLSSSSHRFDYTPEAGSWRWRSTGPERQGPGVGSHLICRQPRNDAFRVHALPSHGSKRVHALDPPTSHTHRQAAQRTFGANSRKKRWARFSRMLGVGELDLQLWKRP